MFKQIIVYVTEADGRDNTIEAAAAFANQLDAKLQGVYVTIGEDPPIIPPFGAVTPDLIEEAINQQEQRIQKARQRFLEITKGLGCSATWQVIDEQSNPLRTLAYADLAITNQADYDPRSGNSNMGFINRLILESGKPVLLIPTGWHEHQIASRVTIGWDESREATRALQDALPLLQSAQQVNVISVNYEGEDEADDLSAISDYLAERNVENQFIVKTTDERLDTPEKVLLNHCQVEDVNLLVIGGYGHTRLREIILGGVTRHMIKQCPVPVFISH